MQTVIERHENPASEAPLAAIVLARSIASGTVSAWMFHAYGLNTQNIAIALHMAASLFSEFWKTRG